MELKGEQMLPLPREQVWAALNDPDILRQCVPGCEAFDPVGDNEYKVVMTAAVGPVKAKFNGALTLSDIQPPSSYRLAFTGSGGAAGFGKGGARVDLESVAGGTVLRYGVNAQVGGKLAQVGARLIDGVAKKMADEFFNRFSKVLAPAGGLPPVTADTSAANTDARPAPAASVPDAPAAAPSPQPPTAVPQAAAPGATASTAPLHAGLDARVLSGPAASAPTVPAARWVWPAIGILAILVIYLLTRH